MCAKKIARLASKPEDFGMLNILPDHILPWEDGLRTNGVFGEYEWWYSDFRLEDGWNLVIIFFSQPVTAATPGYKPSATFSLTCGEEEYYESFAADIKNCEFARDHCRVVLSDRCWIEGDLNKYTVHFENDKVKAHVELVGNAASWRPETGHIFFNERKYFAWLPSVPEGSAVAEISAGGKTMTLKGTGYHDHNWGNTGMFWLMHHWYWGRAKIGEYQAITSYITARKEYGYEHFKIYLLLKNGEKIGDDPNCVTYAQSDAEFDPVTQKHYHKTIVYDYDDGKQHYRITYRAKEIIEYFTAAQANKNNASATAGPALLWLVKLCKLAPSYLRLFGNVTLERFEGDTVVECVEEQGIWEQMYFGLDEDV
ncbi:MAG: hypothetical protein IKT47_02425 [Oscillospiraceae bacterium]|nr:hypothetical protein [Oscillospiraceae bacterium]